MLNNSSASCENSLRSPRAIYTQNQSLGFVRSSFYTSMITPYLTWLHVCRYGPLSHSPTHLPLEGQIRQVPTVHTCIRDTHQCPTPWHGAAGKLQSYCGRPGGYSCRQDAAVQAHSAVCVSGWNWFRRGLKYGRTFLLLPPTGLSPPLLQAPCSAVHSELRDLPQLRG
jgi:hypothetical protein